VLYRSLQAALAQNPLEQWAPGLEQCAADSRYGFAARVLAGLLLVGRDPQQAFVALSGVLRSGMTRVGTGSSSSTRPGSAWMFPSPGCS